MHSPPLYPSISTTCPNASEEEAHEMAREKPNHCNDYGTEFRRHWDSSQSYIVLREQGSGRTHPHPTGKETRM